MNSPTKRTTLNHLFLLLVVLFSIFLKRDILFSEIRGKHIWRQSQTCLNIRNFVRYDFNILNPRVAAYNRPSHSNISRMEFPLMQWLIAGIQKLTYESIIVTRLFMLFTYLLSCIAVYILCRETHSSLYTPAIGVFIFSFFPVYLYQSINPIPDNFSLCLILFYLVFFFKSIRSKSINKLYYSALFLCLAGMCKLPFILYGIMPLIYLFNNSKWDSFRNHMLLAFLLTLVPVVSWYGLVIPNWNGNRIMMGVFDSTIDWDLYLNFLKLQLTQNIPFKVIGLPFFCILGLSTILFALKKKPQSAIRKYYISLLFIYILYFLFVLKQIREGHDYYFLPILPIFLFFLLNVFDEYFKPTRIRRIAVVVFVITTSYVHWNEVKDSWNLELGYFNEDFFIYQKELKDKISDDELCIFINDPSEYIIPYLLNKNGFVFRNDYLPIEWIKDMSQNHGVKYMYSDSRPVENQKGFKEIVDTTLLSLGSVNVYKLK